MFRKSIILIISAGLFFLFSCAEPIDRELIQIAEDIFPPGISDIMATSGEHYYSEVTIVGIAEDNSLSSDDGEGTLAAISYTTPSSFIIRGKIIIDNDGNVSKDTNFGPGDIIYNPDTGEFSFSFDTDIPGQEISGTLTVFVELEDANGNSIVIEVVLIESTGPYFIVDMYDENDLPVTGFAPLETIYFEGTASNSYDPDQIDLADEIQTLEWSIINKGIVYTLDLSAVTPVGSVYTMNIPDNTAIHNPDFTFNSETREFESDFYIPYSWNGSILQFQFKVTDKNGHETTYERFLTPKSTSPELEKDSLFGGFENNATIYFDGLYYYYSPKGNMDIVIKGKVKNNGPVDTFFYNVRAFGNDSTSGNISLVVNDNESFSIPVADSYISLSGLDDSDNVEIFLSGKNGDLEGQEYYSIFADGHDPITTDYDLTNNEVANSGRNDGYAATGDVIEIEFDVSDIPGLYSSGLDIDSLSVDLGSSAMTIVPADDITDNGNGTYSVLLTETLSSNDAGTNAPILDYTVTVSDNVGNQYSNRFDTAVQYYIGDPVVDTDFSYDISPAAMTYVTEGDTVEIDLDFMRDVENVSVWIAGEAAVPSAGDVYSVYLDSGNHNADKHYGVRIPYIISFDDMAGNQYNVSESEVLSQVYYDWNAPGAAELEFSGLTLGTDDVTYINSEDTVFTIVADLPEDNGGSGDDGEEIRNGDIIRLYYGSTLIETSPGLADNDTSYTFTINSTDHPAVFTGTGNKNFYTIITDVAGNPGPQSDTITAVREITPPTINSISHDEYDDSGNIIDHDQTVKVLADVSGSETCQITITQSGGPVVLSTRNMNTYSNAGNSFDYDYNWSLSGYSAVDYIITIDAFDMAGNKRTSELTVTVDISRPTITNVTPDSDNLIKHDGNRIRISADISDNLEPGSTEITIEHSGSNPTINAVDMTLNSGTEYYYDWDIPASTTADEYTVTINATDVTNRSAVEYDFVITIDNSSPSAPVISSTGTHVNASQTNFDIDVGLTSGEEAGDTLTLLLEGSEFGDPSEYIAVLDSTDIGTGSYTFTVDRSDLGAEGSTNVLTAYITDVVNVDSAESNEVTKILDTITPTGYSVTSFTYSASTVSFEIGSITEVTSPQVRVHYTLSRVGGPSLAPAVSSFMDIDSVSLINVPTGTLDVATAGSLRISVYLEDEAGNMSGPVVTRDVAVGP